MAITKVTRTLLSTGIVDNSNATAITIDSSENVGIGTGSPSGGAVGGKVLHLVNSGGTASLRVDRSDSTTAGTISLLDANSTHGLYGTGSKPMAFSTNSTEKMRIDSSGNVGIGTSSPSAVLETFGGTSFVGAKFKGYSSGKTALVGGDLNTVWFGDDDGSIGTVNNFNIRGAANTAKIVTNSIARVTVDGSGNVGIGTTSPSQLLTVSKAGDSYIQVNNSSAGFNTYLGTFTNESRIVCDGAKPIAFFVNGSRVVDFANGGNVGIGTSSPTDSYNYGKTLDIHGSTGAVTYLRDSDATSNFGFLAYDGGTTNRCVIGGGGTAYLRFISAGAECGRFDSSGNLLVGTTNSTFLNEGFRVFPTGSSGGTLVECFNDSGGTALFVGRGGSNGTCVDFRRGSSQVGTISVTTSATSYNTSSDYRLKDITGEARGLEVINELNPVAYNWKADGKADEGLIAQEVLDIVPNAVSGSEEEMYQMDYSKLVVHLVAGMKEQQTIIDDLKTRIETLENV